MIRFSLALLAALALTTTAAYPDTIEAQCALKPAGSKALGEKQTCHFSQSQGYVTITLADETQLNFSPAEGAGNYIDDGGQRVMRKKGRNGAAQIYETPKTSIYVYW